MNEQRARQTEWPQTAGRASQRRIALTAALLGVLAAAGPRAMAQTNVSCPNSPFPKDPDAGIIVFGTDPVNLQYDQPCDCLGWNAFAKWCWASSACGPIDGAPACRIWCGYQPPDRKCEDFDIPSAPPVVGPPGPVPACPTGNCPVPRPVAVTTGEMFFSHSDATVGDLSFVRTFNSARSQGGRFGAFGARWNHSFETRLRFIKPRLIEVRLGDGEPIIYQDTLATGLFTAAFPTSSASWLETIAGGYKRTFRLGGYETYDSAGRMLTSVDRGGVATNYTRDSDGRLVQVARLGRTIVIGYQGADTKPLQLQGPGGAVLASYSYNAGQELEQVTYGDGSGYRYVYDGFGRVNLITDLADKLVERHEYDASGRAIVSEIGEGKEKLSISYGTNQTTVTDALGNGTLYEYQLVDRIPRVKKITGPCISCGDSGDSQEWTYFDTGQIKTYKNGDLKTWTYDYYFPEGDLKTETDPLGRVTTYTYENGHLKTRTALGEGTTTITEGPAGPLSVQDGLNQTTEITYHATLGKPETIKDPRLKITTLVYDTQTGDLTSVKDPLDHSTSFGYDAYGRRTTVTDPLNHTTTTAYDARGRVTRVTSHDGTYTDFKYDKGGRRTEVIDPLRRSTRYLYDVYGRLETVVDAMNGTTKYGYDAMSNLTSLTDANGNTTSFEYFPSRQVKKVVYPGGAFESFTYSPSGRLQTKTDRKNVTTTYTYDDVGRLTGKTYSDGTLPVTYTYTFNAAGRVDTAANGTDTLTWTFDLAGQLLSEQSSKNASTVAYTYDPAGNRKTLRLDGTPFVSYAYDDASRLKTITRGSSVFGFGYDNANRRTSMTYPNGVNTTYAYDDLNRLRSLQANRVSAPPTSAPITYFIYSYDAAGNRITKQREEDSVQGYIEAYTYDPLDRLTQAERTGSLTGVQTWSYDAVGNRLTNQKDGAVATSSYNEKNQLTNSAGGGLMLWRGTLDEPGSVNTFTNGSVNGKPARMLPGSVFEALLPMNSGSSTVTIEARDTSGNVATKSYSVNVTGGGSSYTWDANGNLATKTEGGDSHVYTWDAENRLTKVETNSVEIASFKYDPRGRRVEKMDGGVTTAFTYNGEDILRQAIGSTFTKYVHGPRIDEPLASEDGSGVLTLLSADDLGSIVSSTNAAGAIVSTVRYDAWGNIESGVPGTFGFTGREPDQTGLGYYRARYYDPKVGRFVSEDPSGFEDGTNLYVYTRDNPVLRTDPTGLASATWYEISMCIKDDLAACQAKRRCANRAEAATTNEYGRDTDGARSNAFKHCFGACCMSRSVGPCRAETTAMWHEWNTSRGPGPTNPRKDWSMDLYNNYQGAARAGLFPAQGCRRICLDAPASYYRPEAPPPAQRPKGSP